MKKKYVLCPDWVTSKSDGDRHFIPAHTLARLYGVSMGECLVAKLDDGRDGYGDRCWRGIPDGLIGLYPDYYGDYKLPLSPRPTKPPEHGSTE